MLYVFTGGDAVAVRARARECIDARAVLGARVERLGAEECTPDALRERANSQSLFGADGERDTIVLDAPSERADALAAVLTCAQEIADSPHTFVLIDTALPAASARELKKVAAEYHEIRSAAKKEFNIFSLADALARRDRKSLWVLLQRARAAGCASEEIVGTLFWQMKTMRLATLTASTDEADLKPFVYEKAKRGARNYGKDELAALSRGLITLYHDGHLGRTDMDLALERWALGI